MPNTMEIKVACWNGEAMYVCGVKRGGSMHVVEPGDIFAFATTALQKLKMACPEALIDGLSHEDIFQLPSKKLIVKEFESLECYFRATPCCI